MAHELPALPYGYDALEPTIDKQTMTLHHDMHHGAYVKNLNAAIEKHPDLASKSAEDLIRNLNAIPEDIRAAVRNNGGGHVNHTMFWKIMKPKGGGEPNGAIAEVIKKTFGNFKDFQTKFNDAGVKQFGSGWVWLAGKSGGEVQILTTPNQDNPISQGLYPHLRQRRLGARLLPEIQQPPPRISRRLVERRQLGRDQQALRRLQIRQVGSRTRTSSPLEITIKHVAPDAFVRGHFLGICEPRMPHPSRAFCERVGILNFTRNPSSRHKILRQSTIRNLRPLHQHSPLHHKLHFLHHRNIA